MKRASIAFMIAALAGLLWAQAPEGAGAPKGKGKGDASDKGAAKGKGKADAKAAAPPAPPAVPQVLRLLRPSTYLVTGHGTNSVFRVTPQGVVLVDTKLAGPGDYERLVELIHGVTPQPVKFVLNTSAKPDSSGNNPKFQAAASEIVTGERSVKLGLVEARSIPFGEATVVYLPTDKVICVGDLYTSTNSAALDAILKLDWTLAVPASGEPVYRAAVEARRKTLP
jgi:hypothetical protein